VTDQEINEAIADACPTIFKRKDTQVYYQFHHQKAGFAVDPTSDLNAMHEVEKCLKTHNEWSDYRRWLANHISATARNRAEAFLRTIGKWRDA
jgi:thermostable 8-oxoguanine DNA glycosylase